MNNASKETKIYDFGMLRYHRTDLSFPVRER